MRRRDFIMLLGGAAMPWPVRANAKAGVPSVGVLSAGTVDSSGHLVDAFTQGLNGLGYVEGKNILIERRYAQGQLDRLSALAAELAGLNVDVILAATGSAALVAQKASKTIPIVFALVTDPVGEGFVSSLARPGGRLTGLTNIAVDLAAKRLQTLQEAVPNLSRIGVLYFQAYPGVALQLAELQRAAEALGKSLLPIEVGRPEEYPAAFEKMMQWQANAAAVIENPIFFSNRERIVALAASSNLPAIYNAREYVKSGGLNSFGASYTDLYRRAATYVDKILHGASPADLPVEQPVKFELTINLKTAKALGLTLPLSVLARADEAIE
jgi:putative tryptophan/tyrosine transport system substrate-binding protein